MLQKVSAEPDQTRFAAFLLELFPSCGLKPESPEESISAGIDEMQVVIDEITAPMLQWILRIGRHSGRTTPQ